MHNKKSYFRTLKNPDWDSLIRLTKAVFYRTVTQTTSFVPNKTRRVVWDSTVIMLRRLTDSLKVEKSSDVHWFSRINLTLSLRVILLVYRRLLSFWSCHVMYRIVVIDTFLGVGLQKVFCQFRYLLSSFFLLDRFIPNFGNLLNLISYRSTGYFRSYLFKFYFMYFFP